jgi:hypothetical protein
MARSRRKRPEPQRAGPFSPLLREARRAALLPGVRLALFGLLALAACWRPLGQAGGMNDFRDSHLLHSYEEAAARTVAEYGQLPLWSPWSCGGLYAWGGPQTRQASPALLLSAALGARRAEPLVLWAFLVLGMEGFFRYARGRTGSVLGALGAAPAFGLVGFTALGWTLGWLNFAGFLLLPWLLVGTRLAARGRVGGVALVAGGFALLLGFGGTYPVPLGALLVTLEAARELLSPRARGRRLAMLGALGATALLTLGAGVFRLWPLLETLSSAPRVMAGAPGRQLVELARMVLVLPDRPGQEGAGIAGIFYVGVPVLVLAAVAGWGRWRAVFPAVVAGLALWLAAGYAAKPSLFAGLRQLPIFETLRYPERFLFPFGLYLAELAALGLGVALTWARRASPWRWGAVGACALAVLGWVLQVHGYEVLSRRAVVVPMPPEEAQPFAQARGNRWAQGHFLALNRGSIACGEAYPVPMSPLLRGDLPQEEYLEEGAEGSARRVAWTPNRLEVEVEAAGPVVLRINQNWHPGWRASVGEVFSREGLLAVRLPAGRHPVVLRFLPRSALGGLAVSGLAWVGLGCVAWRARRRGGRMGWEVAVAALVPLLAWGALRSAWPEPPAPPVLRNPDGSALQVEALPAGARPVGARFDAPVELVAAEVPPAPDAEGIVPLVLYWKLTKPLPRSVGIFVHVVGPGGERKSGDHALLGGTYFFDDAPRGVLLRDAFAVSTRDWPAGEWQVLVGLWHATGNGSRIGAKGADGQPVHEARVPVGAFTVPAKAQAP